MSQPEQTSLPGAAEHDEPQTEAEVYAKAEGKVSVLKRELSEMRVIGDRLESLAPESRKRVLKWLTEHYAPNE
jgi:hypothetical protein